MCRAQSAGTVRRSSPGFAVPVPALLFVGCARCHAFVLADGVGQRRPDLLRELQFLFYVCDLIEKVREVSDYFP